MTEIRAFSTSFQDTHDGLVIAHAAGESVGVGELVLLYEVDQPSFASWGRVAEVRNTAGGKILAMCRLVGEANEHFNIIYADDE